MGEVPIRNYSASSALTMVIRVMLAERCCD